MSAIKMHTPYCYLAKNAEESTEFELFIWISYFEGEQIQMNPIEYTNGTTFVSFSITGIPHSIPEQKEYHHKIPLRPLKNRDNFNPELFSIEAICNHQVLGEDGSVNIVKQSCRQYYADADLNTDLLEDFRGHKIAYNCPYVYLAALRAVEGASFGADYEQTFDPYCRLMPYGYAFDPDLQDIKEDENIYKQILNLQALTTNERREEITEIEPQHIQSNSETYTEYDVIDGLFEVEVNILLQGRPQKRRGRVRNADSDTNPNSFIDRSPFSTLLPLNR